MAVEEITAPTAIGMGGIGFGGPKATPQLNVTDRKVVTESNLSLLVKDVSKTITDIQDAIELTGGYMVNRNIYSPEEKSSGYITVRVPTEKVDTILIKVKSLAVKVVSENIKGTDITDQYMDIESRLKTLQNTKTIFEGILAKATDVEEILNVQERILYVQDQIDYLQGQLNYMDATTSSSLITINLAEDELALPYMPETTWRPDVIFKLAVRSLITNLRSVGTAAIWLGLYAVVIVPIVLLVKLVIKMVRKKSAGKKK